MTTNEYRVTGMTCRHCELSVEEEVGQLPGIVLVEVSATTGELRVTGDRAVDDRAVVAAVEEAGYQAVPIR